MKAGLILFAAAICSAVVLWHFAVRAASSYLISVDDQFAQTNPGTSWNIFLLVAGGIVAGWIVVIWVLMRSREGK